MKSALKKIYQAITGKEQLPSPEERFYSPLIFPEDITPRENEIWKNISVDGVQAIDLNANSQIELVAEISQYYKELPFSSAKSENLRYYFDNNYYSYTDGIFLYSLMRHYKSRNIIEVGSGYSSALMLDVNELFFDNKINLHFIEPQPQRLFSLMSERDKKNAVVITRPVQYTEVKFFEKLERGDILFIDGSHVSKCDSDVNFALFEILPALKSGVLVHFHDIFYPFEYPKELVYKRWHWNEDYFLRSFLMYNNVFKIRLFAHYLHLHHAEIFKDMPLCYKNTGGNIWLEKQ